MTRLRWFVAGLIAAATLYWARLAWRDRGGATWATDPDTGLRLRTGLTSAELAAAREAEAIAVLVG